MNNTDSSSKPLRTTRQAFDLEHYNSSLVFTHWNEPRMRNPNNEEEELSLNKTTNSQVHKRMKMN